MNHRVGDGNMFILDEPGELSQPMLDYLWVREKMKMHQRTMTRRFYKTQSAIRRPQILLLMHEAIAAAQKELAEKPEVEEIYIAEVVRVVRRTQPVVPVVVEEVVG